MCMYILFLTFTGFSVLVDDSCAIISSVGDMVIIKTCSFDVPGTGCTVYQYVSPKMFSIKVGAGLRCNGAVS